MNRLIFFFSLFFTLLLLLTYPPFTQAATPPVTYYVDKDSVGGTCSDSTNSGTSISAPFCTFNKAHSVATAGDTVYFRRGVYPPMLITSSGSSSSYITFASYTGERAIIDAQGADYGIRANNTRYIEIRGFEVKNAGGNYEGGIYIRGQNVQGTDYTVTLSSHNRVIQNIVHDNKKGTNWTYGIRAVNSSHNIIENNESYNNFKCGITVEGNENVTLVDNHIQKNKVHHNNDGAGDADGICVSGNRNRGTVIRENVIYENGDDGIDVWNSSGNMIEKNLIYNHNGTGDGNGIKAGGTQIGGANTIRYNISHSNKAHGFDSNGNGGNIYFNNVAFNNGEYGFEDGWRETGSTGCTPSTSRCHSILKNNIGFNNGKANLSADENTKTSDYNLWFSNSGGAKVSYDYVIYNTLESFRTASGMNLDEHSISADPKFVNPTAGDFHLQNNSPAINVGTVVNLNNDFESKPIPVGPAPDMGALESDSTLVISPTLTTIPSTTPTQPNTYSCTTADINKSGKVDLTDYSILVRDFLRTPFNPAADINSDGRVDLIDYSILTKFFLVDCSPSPTVTVIVPSVTNTPRPTNTIAVTSPTRTPTITPTRTPTSTPTTGQTDLPAFPGAEGFGAVSKGGRGGKILLVTNTNDSGAGSLRQALEVETGPRTIVFTTGGTITLTKPLELKGEAGSYVTIAGQTAPGGGIQIKDYGIHLYHGVHDVVIRYLKVRVGQRSGYNFVDDVDGIELWGGTAPVSNIVIDHVSAEWALDENLSVWENVSNVSFQYNIIAEATTNGQENKHAKGMIIGTDSSSKLPKNMSIHHNVFANNPDRNPRVAFADTDYRNNIIYNWYNNNSVMFGEYQSSYGSPTRVNAINNIWKKGPSSGGGNEMIWANKGLKMFVQGNWSPLCPTGCTNEWGFGIYEEISPWGLAAESKYRVTTQYSFPSVTTHSTNTLMNHLLPIAGASFPSRDAADTRIINSVVNGTGAVGISAGGYPTLAAGTAPTDTDQDGIPNTWEQSNGLNSNLKTDALLVAPSGYTWIEEYINSLVP